jgi:hypothetical protein
VEAGEHVPEPLASVTVQMTFEPCSTDTVPVGTPTLPGCASFTVTEKTSNCSFPQVPVADEAVTDVVVSAAVTAPGILPLDAR